MKGLTAFAAGVYLVYSIITDLIIWGAAIYYAISSWLA